MGLNLGDIVNFEQLSGLSTARRLVGLATATGDMVQKLNQELKDGKAALDAKTMDELRPLMDRIVPAALDEGEALDDKLDKAKG